MKIGIIGIGCVGSALQKDFVDKNLNIFTYDKYKNNGVNTIDDVLYCDIIFLCLPTPYDPRLKSYNKSAIIETCTKLKLLSYNGLVVLKSTVEPETTDGLYKNFGLDIIHNPEFLTASTAYEDFKNQKHIVIGYPKNSNSNIIAPLKSFYEKYYPDAEISIMKSSESELMKLGVNTFYSVKIQYFNELYLLANKLGISYEKVKDTMLKNNWINPMHTKVPGTDGKLAYGGMCFPKDTNALNEYLKRKDSQNAVLDACIKERNSLRSDQVFNSKNLTLM